MRKQVWRKAAGLLPALAMVLSLLPAAAVPARAAGTAASRVRIAGVDHDLVIGERVMSEHANCLYTGGVLYLFGSLDGAMYEFDQSSHKYAAIWANGDLTIELGKSDAELGDSHICGTPGANAATAYGIYVEGNLTIQNGEGGLDPKFLIQAWDVGAEPGIASEAICCDGSLTVDNTGSSLAIKACGGRYGVHAENGVSIRSATVEAYAGATSESRSCGLYSGGPLEISSPKTQHAGTLKGFGGAVTASKANSWGVYAYGGLSMPDGVLYGEGGSSANGDSCGVLLGGTGTVNRIGDAGGAVSVTAKGGQGSSSSCGMKYAGWLTVGGSATLDLSTPDSMTGTSSAYALFGGSLILKHNARVIAQNGKIDNNTRTNYNIAVYLSGSLRCQDKATLRAQAGEGSARDITSGLIASVLVMDGGLILAQGGDKPEQSAGRSVGVETNTLTVNGGTLAATSGNVAPTGSDGCSYGLCLKGSSLTVNGGSVAIAAGAAGKNSSSYGLCLEAENASVNVTGGRLTASGYKGAVYAYHDWSVSTPVMTGSLNRGGADAALAEAYDKDWKYVSLDARDRTCAAALDGTTLTWRAKLTGVDGGRAIAAWYDASGRMLGCSVASFTCEDALAGGTLNVAADAAAYRLMLVDDTTCAPLCDVWDNL